VDVATPMPIQIAPMGATLPQAGVIATSPATAAVAGRAFAFPLWREGSDKAHAVADEGSSPATDEGGCAV
jgi:hypothetical protein